MFGGNFCSFVLFVCYRTKAKFAFISSFAPRVLSYPLELDYSHMRVSIAPCAKGTVLHTKDKDTVVVADALGEVQVGINRVAVDGVELGAEDGDVVVALDAELNVLSGAGEVWRRREMLAGTVENWWDRRCYSLSPPQEKLPSSLPM